MVDIFYVYEWFIVDTYDVFYVGKGTGVRRFELHNRNQYFKAIYRKYRCAVRVIHQYLTNDEACALEIERIAELKALGQAKCNFTSGGTGFSTGDLNPTRRNPHFGNKNGMRIKNIDFKGEKNPFFGKTHSEQVKSKISLNRKGKGGQFGPDNPMFGKEGHRGERNGMFGRTKFDHPNSRIFLVQYPNEQFETLMYKQCEKKFGIAFMRIQENGGVLAYKKNTPNKLLYEGTVLKRVK